MLKSLRYSGILAAVIFVSLALAYPVASRSTADEIKTGDKYAAVGRPTTNPYEANTPSITVNAATQAKAKLTAECFVGKEFHFWRSPNDLENFLPVTQPIGVSTKLQVHVLSKEIALYYSPISGVSLHEMVVAAVGAGFDDVPSLSERIIASGKTVTLVQIEDLIKHEEQGDTDTYLDPKGVDNIFFIVGKDGATAFLACARKNSGQWRIHIRQLDEIGGRWIGERLFF